MLLLLFLVIFSAPAYSYLSDLEKKEFERCPLKTYVNVTGDGVRDIGCKDIVIEQGYEKVYLNTSCDWDSISAFLNHKENYLGGKAFKERGLWKLYDFRAKSNPYLLSCVISKTKLEDIEYIWVNIRQRYNIEADLRQKEISKKLDTFMNKTEKQIETNINKSDEIIKGITDLKNITSETNTTTTQTNTTLIKAQESQNCKDKFNLLVVILGIFLEVIFVILGLINKRNKKLQQKLWILAFVVIFVMIISMITITFFICNL